MLSCGTLDDARSHFLHAHERAYASPPGTTAAGTRTASSALAPRVTNRATTVSENTKTSTFTPLRGPHTYTTTGFPAPAAATRSGTGSGVPGASTSSFVHSTLVENLSSILAAQPCAAHSPPTFLGDDDTAYVDTQDSRLGTPPFHGALPLSSTASFHSSSDPATGASQLTRDARTGVKTQAASGAPLPRHLRTETRHPSVTSTVSAESARDARVAADAVDLVRAFARDHARPPPPVSEPRSSPQKPPTVAASPLAHSEPAAPALSTSPAEAAHSAADFQAARQRAQQLLFYNATARQEALQTNLEMARRIYVALLKGKPHAPSATPTVASEKSPVPSQALPAACGSPPRPVTFQGILRPTSAFAARSSPAATEAPAASGAPPCVVGVSPVMRSRTPPARTRRASVTLPSDRTDVHVPVASDEAGEVSHEEPGSLLRCGSNHTLPFMSSHMTHDGLRSAHSDPEDVDITGQDENDDGGEDSRRNGWPSSTGHTHATVDFAREQCQEGFLISVPASMSSPSSQPARRHGDVRAGADLLRIPRRTEVEAASADARRAMELLSTVRLLRRQTEDMTLHLLHACGEGGCWHTPQHAANAPPTEGRGRSPRQPPSLFRDLFVYSTTTGNTEEEAQAAAHHAAIAEHLCTATHGSPLPADVGHTHEAFVRLFRTPFTRRVPPPPSTSTQLEMYQRYQTLWHRARPTTDLVQTSAFVPTTHQTHGSSSTTHAEAQVQATLPQTTHLSAVALQLKHVREKRRDEAAHIRALLDLPEPLMTNAAAPSAPPPPLLSHVPTALAATATATSEADGAKLSANTPPRSAGTTVTPPAERGTSSSSSSTSPSSASSPQEAPPVKIKSTKRYVTFKSPHRTQAAVGDPDRLSINERDHHEGQSSPPPLSSAQLSSFLGADEQKSPGRVQADRDALALLRPLECSEGAARRVASPLDFPSVLTDDHLPNARWMVDGQLSAESPTARQRARHAQDVHALPAPSALPSDDATAQAVHGDINDDEDVCGGALDDGVEGHQAQKRRHPVHDNARTPAPLLDHAHQASWLPVLSAMLLDPSPREGTTSAVEAPAYVDSATMAPSRIQTALHALRQYADQRAAAEARTSAPTVPSATAPSQEVSEDAALQLARAWVEKANVAVKRGGEHRGTNAIEVPSVAVMRTLQQQLERATALRETQPINHADFTPASSRDSDRREGRRRRRMRQAPATEVDDVPAATEAASPGPVGTSAPSPASAVAAEDVLPTQRRPLPSPGRLSQTADEPKKKRKNNFFTRLFSCTR